MSALHKQIIINSETSSLSECSSYLNPSRPFGTFSFLEIEHGASRKEYWKQSQNSHLLHELPDVLPEYIERSIRERKHLYISQATFRKRNRQRSAFLSVSTLFVDLDIYRATLLSVRNASKEVIADKIELLCMGLGIPLPSFIIDSGRGMYAKWIIGNEVTKHSLSYWEAIQRQLNAAFADFGADTNAMDVNRVLRVVDSVNFKGGSSLTCSVMRTNYEPSSATQVQMHSLCDFESIMPFTLTSSQEFLERMAANNAEFRKNGAKINREKQQRLVILECLKELDSAGFINDDYTANQLNEYIKTTRQLARFSLKACQDYLPKFLKQKAKYAAYTGPSSVIPTKSRFELVRRNWGLYTDILEVAKHRYGDNGVDDGLRDSFMYIACNQYCLSEWKKKSADQINEQIIEIGDLLVPEWDEKRIASCLSSVRSRLATTQATQKNNLYRFTDSYIQQKLEITPQELEIVGTDGQPLIREALGDNERNRRDPNRQETKKTQDATRSTKRRRKAGAVERSSYEADSAKRQAQAKRLHKKGASVSEIMTKVGISRAQVYRYIK